MDALDRKIIGYLLDDARTPYARMAEDLGLATATVHQRVRKLRDSGAIQRLTAKVDWSMLDLPVEALISVNVTSRRSLPVIGEHLARIPWIVGCALVSGQFDLLVRVRAHSPAHLGEIIDAIRQTAKGSTQTLLVLNPFFDRNPPLGGEMPALAPDAL